MERQPLASIGNQLYSLKKEKVYENNILNAFTKREIQRKRSDAGKNPATAALTLDLMRQYSCPPQFPIHLNSPQSPTHPLPPTPPQSPAHLKSPQSPTHLNSPQSPTGLNSPTDLQPYADPEPSKIDSWPSACPNKRQTAPQDNIANWPRLDYVELPQVQCFKSDEGLFSHFSDRYHFSVFIPKLAVAEGEEVEMKVGICSYGPFSIGKEYTVVSDFAVIVTSGKFRKPVQLFMNHCLANPEQSSIVILKADHDKVTEDGRYSFREFQKPEVTSNTVHFQADNLCIVCAAARKTDFNIQSENWSIGLEHRTPQDHPEIKHTALLFQPAGIRALQSTNDVFRFIIFVCMGCPGSREICRRQAKARKILDTDVELVSNIQIAYKNHGIHLEWPKNPCQGWTVKSTKNATMNDDEVRYYTKSKEHLEILVNENATCPPRVVFSARCDQGTTQNLSCKITLKGASVEDFGGEDPFFEIPEISPPLRPPTPNCSTPIKQNRETINRQVLSPLLMNNSGDQSSGYDSSINDSCLPSPLAPPSIPEVEQRVDMNPGHVGMLLRILCEHAGQWSNIGLAIGFSQAELDAIRANHPGDVTDCLTTVLTKWTQWPVEGHEVDPTLEELLNALRAPFVGLGNTAKIIKRVVLTQSGKMTEQVFP